ncbi:hypothetical protein F383_10133 [Gossypium arboreum]|uniref:Uncharacterized protein n=1 Tax=Gossypium arboreum TaxID=29729 RepID=A0A0B0NKP3_GOSAR|nr:hypothetical protein F383_10133 [Gossypium arboreum]
MINMNLLDVSNFVPIFTLILSVSFAQLWTSHHCKLSKVGEAAYSFW